MSNTSTAESLPKLDFRLDESTDDLTQHLLSVCKTRLSSWADVSKDGTEVRCRSPFLLQEGCFQGIYNTPPDCKLGIVLQVNAIGGGITNKLYHIKTAAGVESVVFRRFGDNTEVFIDREIECSNTLQLNVYGFGARLLATFANGRIESFLDGYTMEPADMRHPLMVPRIAKRLAEFHSCKIQTKDQEPGLWTTIQAW